MTDQRKVVAQITANAADHPDPEDLCGRVLSSDDQIGMVTVNRTLRHLKVAQKREWHDVGAGPVRNEPTEDGDGSPNIVNVRNREVVKVEAQTLEHLKKPSADNPVYQIVCERFQLYCEPMNNEGAFQ